MREKMSWIDARHRGGDLYFPDIPGWEMFSTDTDKWGDATEVRYESEGLFVYVRSDGTWNTTDGDRGYWDPTRPSTIEGVLDRLKSEHQDQMDDLVIRLRKMASQFPNWNTHIDEKHFSAQLTTNDPYLDDFVSVSIEFLDDLLDGEADAEIFYAAGSDYQGHYGKDKRYHKVGSVADVANLMRRAEQLLRRKTRNRREP
jgi:hypothetical protein